MNSESYSSEEPEWVEPEVLPPEGEPYRRTTGLWHRLEQTFGPIAAGLVIDGLDLATFSQIGLLVGMLIGGSAAYWMTSIYRLPVWQRVLWALAAGLYCSAPRTEMIPLATIIGAGARFWQSGRPNFSN